MTWKGGAWASCSEADLVYAVRRVSSPASGSSVRLAISAFFSARPYPPFSGPVMGFLIGCILKSRAGRQGTACGHFSQILLCKSPCLKIPSAWEPLCTAGDHRDRTPLTLTEHGKPQA